MAKADELTFSEFSAINSRLKQVSDVWSDLWVVIYYSQMSIGKLLSLRFEDVSGVESLKISGNINLLTDNPVKQIIKKRRELYPDDIFLFQSHSNRVKSIVKSVTVIAFNQALKSVAKYVTNKNVSSSSARRVQKISYKAA